MLTVAAGEAMLNYKMKPRSPKTATAPPETRPIPGRGHWETAPVRGFSLIELIAAMAVLVVLAAILTPVASGMLARAREAACAANLRAVGGMLGAYAADNGGRTVPAYRDSKTWGELLLSFAAGSGQPAQKWNAAFRCPENRVQEMSVGAGSGEEQTSYAINGFATSPNPSENRYADQPLGNIARPSSLYAVTESRYYRTEPQTDAGKNVIPEGLYTTGVNNARYPHSGRMNVLFADGHVESVAGPLEGRGTYQPSLGQAGQYSNGNRWYAR